MTTKRLIFKGRDLLEKSGEANANQFAHRIRVSAQTAYKYIHAPEELTSVDCRVLAGILLDGLGLTEKQALDLKISDLFEFSDK